MVDEFVLPCLPAIVLDVWKVRKEDIAAQRTATERKPRVIDATTYRTS